MVQTQQPEGLPPPSQHEFSGTSLLIAVAAPAHLLGPSGYLRESTQSSHFLIARQGWGWKLKPPDPASLDWEHPDPAALDWLENIQV
jgi:hypothetical protein